LLLDSAKMKVGARHFTNNVVCVISCSSLKNICTSARSKYIDVDSGGVLEVRNLANDELAAKFHVAGEHEVDSAVSAARNVFKSGPWSTFSAPSMRSAC
jgi:hypothetical protein